MIWNAIANMGGRLWSAALSVVVVPVFVRVLGAEAYGLVGLFASLQVIFVFLDLGLSATINREIAQNVARGNPPAENKIMLRTFETIYWSIGIVIGSTIFMGSGWVAANWINPQQLSHEEVRLAIIILALSFAARWPVSLYSGVLQGLQKQVLQNLIFTVAVSVRVLGALAVIVWVSPTLTAFLLTQVLANILEVAASGLTAWKALGPHSAEPAHFRPEVLGRTWRFALSFNMVGVLGIMLSQADRLVISKFLPLEQLGYYSIAGTAVGAMPLISSSVTTAVFPRFSAQAATGDRDSMARHYHGVVQAIAFPAVGIALAVAFFSFDILALWTQSVEIAHQTSVALSLLAIASLLNAVQNPAYNLLVAHGHTRIPLITNGANAILFIPTMLALIPFGGIQAAAAIWLAQNLVALSIYLFFVRKIIREGESPAFFARDVLYYLLLGCLWLGGTRLLTLANTATPAAYLGLLVAGIGYCASVLFVSRITGVFPLGLLI